MPCHATPCAEPPPAPPLFGDCAAGPAPLCVHDNAIGSAHRQIIEATAAPVHIHFLELAISADTQAQVHELANSISVATPQWDHEAIVAFAIGVPMFRSDYKAMVVFAMAVAMTRLAKDSTSEFRLIRLLTLPLLVHPAFAFRPQPSTRKDLAFAFGPQLGLKRDPNFITNLQSSLLMLPV